MFRCLLHWIKVKVKQSYAAVVMRLFLLRLPIANTQQILHFFRDQNPVLRFATPRLYLKAGRVIAAHYRKKKGVAVNTVGQQAELASLAQSLAYFPAPHFSVTLPSRYVGNIDNNLAAMLLSLYANAILPREFEVLIAVDADDDLGYYAYIKHCFADYLNIRVIVGPAKRGYENLHLINADLSSYMAVSSEAILVISDDTCIHHYLWDLAIRAMTVSHHGKIYMAHSIQNPNAHLLSPLCDESEYLLNLWKIGPRCFHPILSRALIELLRDVTKEKDGWDVFGNTMMSDSFFDILEYILHTHYEQNILLECPNLGRLFPQNVAAHKEGAGWGNSPVVRRALSKLMDKDTLSGMHEIAAHIARALGKESV